ncbi:MAG: hypothetical protein ACRD2A_09880 [Vicinamibacterales bacterium]
MWLTRHDGSHLACAFALGDAGAFEWGPKADRVLTSRLEVRNPEGAILQRTIDARPVATSWGHPTGKSIAFIDATARQNLKKVTLGGRVTDITPLKGVTYKAVEYHPSGLGIAVAVEGTDVNAVWLSSNTGTQPKRLVGTTKGTTFSALAFEADGQTLLYAATISDGTSRLGRYFLTEGTADEGLWAGAQPILRIARGARGPGIAFDTGTDCSDRRAFYSKLDTGKGEPLLPRASTPTSVLGRIGEASFLIAAGPCNGPFDLWVATLGSKPVLLVKHVDGGAVRIPEPGPPPAMPEVGISSRFF